MNLETDRLKIQKFSWGDFDSYAALVGDTEVMKFSLKGPLTKVDIYAKTSS